MPQDQVDVFISYRWTEPDATWVRNHLCPALRASGLRVILDVDDFIPGRDLILEMTRAHTQSKHLLCVISPDYFDGERMVHFESLMRRRNDPSGDQSALVPLIIRAATLPEWIRGLIPVDWTGSQSEREREWTKLLRALNAPKPNVAAPPAIAALTGESTEQANRRSATASTIRPILELPPPFAGKYRLVQKNG